jgi:D-alanine---D-serine ligase
MNKLALAVIFGGNSPEYEVSLKSAAAVIGAVDREKYDVIAMAITPDGEWMRYYGDEADIASDAWRKRGERRRAVISPSTDTHGIVEFDETGCSETRLDIAFPVMHGQNGEDGTVQGLLELAGIPIVGSGTLPSALCMDKELSHMAVREAGLQCPRNVSIIGAAEAVRAREAAAKLGYPLFVKPARAGSSFGVTCVRKPEELDEAVKEAFKFDGKVLLEERVEGCEVGCAVVGPPENPTIDGWVDEIELQGDVFDFEEKYTLRTSKIHCPARIPPDVAERVKDTAARAYRALGCEVFARIDMFLTPSGQILFSEANTIPGFTAHSRFPSMMRGAGYTFEQTISLLIDTATGRRAAP